MSTELATIDGEVIEQRAPMTLFGTDDPTAVVERASTVATALASVINERRLFTSISGKKHVQVEGWTLLGSMLGVFAEVEWSRPLANGWEARAVARTLAGNVVGAAEAMCTVDEPKWKGNPSYAVRSMAQTRAVSKALRMPLGFIMHLAGYSATPAEEMVEDQPDRSRGPARAASSPSGSAPVQTDGALRDAVAAAAAEHHVGTARLSLIADSVGVSKGQRANADQLRAILAAIETPQSEGSPASAGSDAATAQGSGVEAVSPGIPPDPASAPSIEDIIAATGGTEVPAEAVA